MRSRVLYLTDAEDCLLTGKCRIPKIMFLNRREKITYLLDGDKLGSQLKVCLGCSLLKTGVKDFSKKNNELFENLKVELAVKTYLPSQQKTTKKGKRIAG